MSYFHPKLRIVRRIAFLFCGMIACKNMAQAQCPTPTGVGISNIQTNTATITWSFFGTTNGFEMELLQSDSTFKGIPTKTNILQSPYTVTDLKMGTLYKFFIRSVCGTDKGAWSGPYIFRTYLANPSNCNMHLPIGDKSCDIKNQFDVQVQNVSGTRLGDDVILKEIKMILKHPWVSDLDISLLSPAGDTLILTQDNGGQGDNLGDITDCTKTCDFVYAPYSCTAKSIISAGEAPFTGKYIPVGDVKKIHKGGNPNGIWRLLVCDDAGNDVGTLEFLELVFSTVTCPIVTQVKAENVTATFADVRWQNGIGCNRIGIEYGVAGFALGTGTKVEVDCTTPQPYRINGLKPLTTYQLYIQNKCTSSNISEHSCPIQFTTNCNTLPASLTETFNNQTLCTSGCGDACAITGTWHNKTIGDNFDWTVFNGTTPTTETGPDNDVTLGGKYLYIETTGGNCQNNRKAALESNCLRVTAPTGACHLSFYYHLYGVETGKLLVEATTDGIKWDSLWAKSGNVGNVWVRQYLELGAYYNQNIRLRFTGFGGNGGRGDIGLDQIEMYGVEETGDAQFTYYKDSDNDGFGDPIQQMLTCAAISPSGYVRNNQDCNDQNANISRAAVELPCNDIDENCNGLADDTILSDPAIQNIAICTGGNANLSIPNNAFGQYYWYDAALSTTPISTGKNFSINNLTASKTFYVQDTFAKSVGLRITEIKPSAITASIEIQNIGNSTDYTGWVVAINDDIFNIDAVNSKLWQLGTLATNAVAYKTKLIANNYWGKNINWSAFNNGWAMILDKNGKVVDAIFWGWTAAEILNINTTINGFNITGNNVPWVGKSIDFTGSCGTTKTISLTTNNEKNDISDYGTGCQNATLGTQNPNGLTGKICKSTKKAVTINVVAQPKLVSLSDTLAVCEGTKIDLAQRVSDQNGSGGALQFWLGTQRLPSNLLTVSTSNSYKIKSIVSNLCSDSSSFFLKAYPKPIVTILPNNPPVLCAGVELNIKANVESGTSPFIYEWNTNQNNPTITVIGNQNPGVSENYNVTVKDKNNCTNTAETLIKTSDGVNNVSVIAITDISACGGSDGIIQLKALNGTPPYRIKWEGTTNGSSDFLQPDIRIANLKQGAYTVTISDAAQSPCEIVLKNLVINGPVASVQIKATKNVTCYGRNDGMIDLTVQGANPIFQWSNGATTQDLLTTKAGTYSVTITDGFCVNTLKDIVIEQPDSLQIIPIIKNVTCFNKNDAAITLNVAGGTLPYAYTWNINQTTKDLTNIGGGTYICSITDAQGCAKTVAQTLINPPTLAIKEINAQNPRCDATNDGKITATIAGGIAPYTVIWNNGAKTTTLNNLKAGKYTASITDAFGCQVVSAVVSLVAPASLAIKTDSTRNITCNSVADAKIFTTASGGTAPYSYRWNNNAITDDLRNLHAGTYGLTLTDAAACTTTSTYTITEPKPLRIDLDSVKALSCKTGGNGGIFISVSGGIAPYNFLWTNNATTKDITGLFSGTYAVKLQDKNGCTITSPDIDVTPKASNFQVRVVGQDNVTCVGGRNGSIDITVAGGKSPYKYAWSNGVNTPDIINIMAGAYQVTVEDAEGCKLISPSVAVTQPTNQLTINLLHKSDVNCADGMDGCATVAIQNGNAPFQYNWSFGKRYNSLKTIDTLCGIRAGSNYKVTITDNTGCVAVSDGFAILAPTALSAFVKNIEQTTCAGKNDGIIAIETRGGKPTFAYKWNNGEELATLKNLKSGFYAVTITDANKCVTTLPTITIRDGEPRFLVRVDSFFNVTCRGNNDGRIYTTAEGTRSPLHYAWNNGAAASDVTGLPPGNYTCAVRDTAGCETLLNRNIPIKQANTVMTVRLDSVVNSQCFGDKKGAVYIGTLGGVSPYRYKWSNNDFSEDAVSLSKGNYKATITDTYGCNLVTPVYSVDEPSKIVITIDSKPATTGSKNGTLIAIPSGGTEPYTYKWSDDQTEAMAINLPSGNYLVKVKDANGCTAETTAKVGIVSATIDPAFIKNITILPNPARDWLFFKAEIHQTKSAHLEIVNTLGQKVKRQSLGKDTLFEASVDISDLPSGTYFVQFMLGDTLVYVRRIVVVE